MKSHRRHHRRFRRALALGLGVMSLAVPSAMAVEGEQFVGPGPANPQSLSPQVGSPDSQDARDHRGVYADSTKQHVVVSPDASDARAHTGVYAQSKPQVGLPDAGDARAHVGVYEGPKSNIGSPDSRDARARVGVYDGSPSSEPSPAITNVVDDGFDWGSAGIGSAITIGLMLLTLVALRSTSRLRTSH